jgi:WD40 repeat protein
MPTTKLTNARGILMSWSRLVPLPLPEFPVRWGTVWELALHPDRTRVVSATTQDLYLWDLEKGEFGDAWGGRHRAAVSRLLLSADGETAFTASQDKTLKIWSVAKRKSVATLKGHQDRVTALSLSPSGRRAVSFEWDGTAKMWDLASKTEVGTAPTGDTNVQSAVFLDEDDILYAGNGGIHRWRVGSDPVLAIRHSSAYTLDVDARRQFALVGDSNNRITRYDLGGMEATHAWEAHASTVVSIALIDGGNQALSIGEDEIKLWNMPDGALVASHKLSGPGFGPARCMSVQGNRVLVGGKASAFDLA